MKKPRATLSLLPLTLLLLLIAFGTISMHHREENSSMLATFAGSSREQSIEKFLADFRDTKSDFDSDMAFRM